MGCGSGKRKRKLIVVGACSVTVLFSLQLQGCAVVKSAAQSMEPAEATFADPDSVMIRAIEPFTVKAEYFDRTKKAIAVKKWTVNPPVWIVNEAMLKSRKPSVR